MTIPDIERVTGCPKLNPGWLRAGRGPLFFFLQLVAALRALLYPLRNSSPAVGAVGIAVRPKVQCGSVEQVHE